MKSQKKILRDKRVADMRYGVHTVGAARVTAATLTACGCLAACCPWRTASWSCLMRTSVRMRQSWLTSTTQGWWRWLVASGRARCVHGTHTCGNRPRNALFKTMRRARRRAEKAAAKKDAGKAETVKEKPKETAAPQKYVSWRVRQARQLEKKGTGKPPKMDDPNDFPSLGGAAYVVRAAPCAVVPACFGAVFVLTFYV